MAEDLEQQSQESELEDFRDAAKKELRYSSTKTAEDILDDLEKRPGLTTPKTKAEGLAELEKLGFKNEKQFQQEDQKKVDKAFEEKKMKELYAEFQASRKEGETVDPDAFLKFVKNESTEFKQILEKDGTYTKQKLTKFLLTQQVASKGEIEERLDADKTKEQEKDEAEAAIVAEEEVKLENKKEMLGKKTARQIGRLTLDQMRTDGKQFQTLAEFQREFDQQFQGIIPEELSEETPENVQKMLAEQEKTLFKTYQNEQQDLLLRMKKWELGEHQSPETEKQFADLFLKTLPDQQMRMRHEKFLREQLKDQWGEREVRLQDDEKTRLQEEKEGQEEQEELKSQKVEESKGEKGEENLGELNEKVQEQSEHAGENVSVEELSDVKVGQEELDVNSLWKFNVENVRKNMDADQFEQGYDRLNKIFDQSKSFREMVKGREQKMMPAMLQLLSLQKDGEFQSTLDELSRTEMSPDETVGYLMEDDRRRQLFNQVKSNDVQSWSEFMREAGDQVTTNNEQVATEMEEEEGEEAPSPEQQAPSEEGEDIDLSLRESEANVAISEQNDELMDENLEDDADETTENITERVGKPTPAADQIDTDGKENPAGLELDEIDAEDAVEGSEGEKDELEQDQELDEEGVEDGGEEGDIENTQQIAESDEVDETIGIDDELEDSSEEIEDQIDENIEEDLENPEAEQVALEIDDEENIDDNEEEQTELEVDEELGDETLEAGDEEEPVDLDLTPAYAPSELRQASDIDPDGDVEDPEEEQDALEIDAELQNETVEDGEKEGIVENAEQIAESDETDEAIGADDENVEEESKSQKVEGSKSEEGADGRIDENFENDADETDENVVDQDRSPDPAADKIDEDAEEEQAALELEETQQALEAEEDPTYAPTELRRAGEQAELEKAELEEQEAEENEQLESLERDLNSQKLEEQEQKEETEREEKLQQRRQTEILHQEAVRAQTLEKQEQELEKGRQQQQRKRDFDLQEMRRQSVENVTPDASLDTQGQLVSEQVKTQLFDQIWSEIHQKKDMTLGELLARFTHYTRLVVGWELPVRISIPLEIQNQIVHEPHQRFKSLADLFYEYTVHELRSISISSVGRSSSRVQLQCEFNGKKGGQSALLAVGLVTNNEQ